MIYLKDKDVSIRDFNKEDIDNKVIWINDEKNNAYLHYNIPLNKEDTLKWFLEKAQKRIDGVIEYQGIPVGLIGLLNIDAVHKKAEFYISMGRDEYKKKGIATAASRLILAHGFETLHLNKIYLNVDEENTAACRLYEKLGFQLEGRFIQDMFFKGRFINRIRYAMFLGNLEN